MGLVVKDKYDEMEWTCEEDAGEVVGKGSV